MKSLRPVLLGLARNQAFRHNASVQFKPYVYACSRQLSTQDEQRVQELLRRLREDLKQQNDDNEKRKSLVADDPKKKLPITTRVVNELKHYYHGFRLLALEIKVSVKYAWMIIRGKQLTRLERQQLIRTLSDVFRLVPFSVFIIVPFMELALPLFIKFFPNMLPSTFQEKSKEEEKQRKQLQMRVQTAKFIQDTLEEVASKRKAASEKSEQAGQHAAYEFSQFMKKVRSEASYVSNQEILRFTKLFEDELTLDNLALPQLRALCRLLGLQTIGPMEILRFQLTMKLRELKADDRMIDAEGGVEALSVPDLQNACRARGMRSIGVSADRLRSQLKSWLEMSLNDKIPPSLLLLSRALYLPEELTFNKRIKSILAALPTHLSEQTHQKLAEMEGGKISYKQRMDLILEIESGLKAEREAQAAEEAAKKNQEAQTKKNQEASQTKKNQEAQTKKKNLEAQTKD